MAMSGKFDPKMLSALDLAFVGDGVYGLLVREMLARDGSRPVGELHRMAVAYVPVPEWGAGAGTGAF